MDQKYITSERFIHDGLVQKSHAIMQKAYEQWQKNEDRDCFFFLWPAETIKTDKGQALNDICVMPLKGGQKSDWFHQMKQAVVRTKAYGILMLQRSDTGVTAIFESRHGAAGWTREAERHGDVTVLGAEKRTVDTEHLGILWRLATAAGAPS